MEIEFIYILLAAVAITVIGDLYILLRSEKRESARLRIKLSATLKELAYVKDSTNFRGNNQV